LGGGGESKIGGGGEGLFEATAADKEVGGGG
jgi:hypothetical protein